MTIEAVSANSNLYASGLQPANLKQVRTDFASLAGALQSGDLAAAQQAFAALQQDQPQIAAASNSSTAGADPLGQAVGDLAGALKSGDLAAAQKAFAALQQAARGVHHGHRHHRATADTTTTSSSSVATDSDGDHDGSPGTLLNSIA